MDGLQPLELIILANMKIQKLKFVRNTASDNQRIFNFMQIWLAHIVVT